jgi:hypothetical protein
MDLVKLSMIFSLQKLSITFQLILYAIDGSMRYGQIGFCSWKFILKLFDSLSILLKSTTYFSDLSGMLLGVRHESLMCFGYCDHRN